MNQRFINSGLTFVFLDRVVEARKSSAERSSIHSLLFFEAGKDGQEFFDFTGFKFRAPKALEHKAARWVLAVGSSEKTCFSRRIQGEFNLLSELWYEMASSNCY